MTKPLVSALSVGVLVCALAGAPAQAAAPIAVTHAVVAPATATATQTSSVRISLARSARNVDPGQRLRLSGKVALGTKSAIRVVLQVRNPGAKNWHRKASTTVASGRYRFDVRPQRSREYRAVALVGKKRYVSKTRAVTAIDSRKPLAGLIVALDPGHNGRNAGRTGYLVPDGRGGRKACNTTGTAGRGITESRFNLAVAQRARRLLSQQGATVIITRDTNDGVGPCVNKRGAFAGEHDADLLVSIHANGSVNTRVRGHFAIVVGKPLNSAQGKPSRTLAAHLLAGLKKQKFSVSTAIRSGMSYRSDLGTLNHATRPAVLLELGEMRNAADIAVMSSSKGQQRYARAIAAGIATWANSR